MHHTRLKAAIARYAEEDLKATQLLAALQADDKEYTTEEVDEIFEAILLEKKTPSEQTNPGTAADHGLASPAAPGYVVCDIWHGSWVATDWMINPMTGQRAAIAFNFLKSGAAKRQKVKVEPRRMEALNGGAHLNITGVIVEQFIPIDHEGEWSYERPVINGIPQ